MSRRKRYKRSRYGLSVFYLVLLVGISGLILGIGLPRAEQGIARVTQGKEPVGQVLRYEEGRVYWLGKEYVHLVEFITDLWPEEKQLIPRAR